MLDATLRLPTANAAFQPKKFTSYERDANSSDEAMFRRYNRWHSRFDQPDPYDGSYSLTDPQSFNRYAYVQGDPVNFVDPTGLWADATSGDNAGCRVDGIPMNCSQAFGLVNMGAATVSGGSGFYLGGSVLVLGHVFRSDHGSWYSQSAYFMDPQNPLADAIDLAREALRKDSCAKLFNQIGSPINLLDNLAAGTPLGSITLGNLGGPINGSVSAADTTGILGAKTVVGFAGHLPLSPIVQSTFTGANIVINSNSAAPFQSGYGGRFGASDAVNRAITLIHELGHVAAIIYGANASRILDDQNNSAQSRANSQLVYDNCFK